MRPRMTEADSANILEREKNAPHSSKPEEIGLDESERYQASGMGTTTVDSGRFMSGLAETVNHPMIN